MSIFLKLHQTNAVNVACNRSNFKHKKSDDYKILNKEDSKFLGCFTLPLLSIWVSGLAFVLHLYNKKNSVNSYDGTYASTTHKSQTSYTDFQGYSSLCLNRNDTEVLKKIKICIQNDK